MIFSVKNSTSLCSGSGDVNSKVIPPVVYGTSGGENVKGIRFHVSRILMDSLGTNNCSQQLTWSPARTGKVSLKVSKTATEPLHVHKQRMDHLSTYLIFSTASNDSPKRDIDCARMLLRTFPIFTSIQAFLGVSNWTDFEVGQRQISSFADVILCFISN